MLKYAKKEVTIYNYINKSNNFYINTSNNNYFTLTRYINIPSYQSKIFQNQLNLIQSMKIISIHLNIYLIDVID